MGTGTTLGALMHQGPDAWILTTAAQLQAACDASVAAGCAAADLSLFLRSVGQWRTQEASHWGRLFAWVSEEARPFLARLAPSILIAAAKELTDLDDRLEFLWLFSEQVTTRRHLGPILDDAGKDLLREMPKKPPDDQTLQHRWGTRLRLWIESAGIVEPAHARARLAELLRAIPRWLLKGLFSDVGRLRDFDGWIEPFTLALPGSEVTAQAFADALAAGGTNRLAHILFRLGRAASATAQEVKPSDVDSWLAAFQRELRQQNSHLADQAQAYVDGAREHSREIAAVFQAYLNARPRNHEQVFDLFSVRQSAEPRSPGADLDLPTVSIQTRGSMRSRRSRSEEASRSLEDASNEPPDLRPSDFDWRASLRGVRRNVLLSLVLDQQSPDFALEYLKQVKLAEHPEFAGLVEQLCDMPDFLRLLRGSSGATAAVVLSTLREMEYMHGGFARLLERVLPDLLAQVPLKLLLFVVLQLRLKEEFVPVLQQEVARRAAEIGSASELATLIKVAVEALLLDEALSKRLGFDGFDFTQLCPPSTVSSKGLLSWAGCLPALTFPFVNANSALVKLLRALPTPLFERIFSLSLFEGKSDQAWPTDVARLLLCKTFFVEEWRSRAPEEAARALKAHLERDFILFFFGDFRDPTWLGAKDDFSSKPTWRWLDTVARTEPSLVPAYLGNLLRHAHAPGASEQGVSLSEATIFTRSWLERHAQEMDPDIWPILCSRLDQLAPDELRGAVSFALIELPSSDAGRRRFREAAVAAVRARLGGPVSSYLAERLIELKSLLRREAPDLLPMLEEEAD